METANSSLPPADQTRRERPKTIVAVHVLLHQKGRVLAMRRINTSYMAGRYCFPGGHVEPGETAAEAAIRETLEECGARIAPQNLKFRGIMHRSTAGQPIARMELFYDCHDWGGVIAIAEPSKFDDLQWVPAADPPAHMVPFMSAALASRDAIPWYREFGWPDRAAALP